MVSYNKHKKDSIYSHECSTIPQTASAAYPTSQLSCLLYIFIFMLSYLTALTHTALFNYKAFPDIAISIHVNSPHIYRSHSHENIAIFPIYQPASIATAFYMQLPYNTYLSLEFYFYTCLFTCLIHMVYILTGIYIFTSRV